MKVSELTLVVWLVTVLYEVLGDKETLVEVPFQQRTMWSHPSTASPVYSTCDIGELITKEPINWLQTDFINVKHAKRVDIEVSYSLLNCSTEAPTSKFCKTFFTLYAYHTDKKEPLPPDPTKGMFQKEAVITCKRWSKFQVHISWLSGN
ncbi:hypothetical protein OS493_019300 [Desmophyllum pertusum]|uniref:Eph LBD domain-containing protein n=1 Tax=Desmophyllum pertusum TaxID=174260 RepID=A0A9X0CGH1_9CNID|nr:hypothetical protein OS493_019300 [Desmophyllum pertusum]